MRGEEVGIQELGVRRTVGRIDVPAVDVAAAADSVGRVDGLRPMWLLPMWPRWQPRIRCSGHSVNPSGSAPVTTTQGSGPLELPQR